MALTKEIITIQLGNYSNYVGAHFWNIQDSKFVFQNPDKNFKPEVNHDVLFREGKSLQGVVTYSPRLISYDLKGCLRGELFMNDLYDGTVDPIKHHLSPDLPDRTNHLSWNNEGVQILADENSWQRNIDRFDPPDEELDEEEETLENEASPDHPSNGVAHSPPPKSIFNSLPPVWSDLLSTRLHPRSFNAITEYLNGSDYLQADGSHIEDQKINFSLFEQGNELFNSEKYLDDWEDRLHFFTEECDYLQGFQIMFDSSNAFSGVALSVMKQLQDDFSKKITWTVPLCPAKLYHTPKQLAQEKATFLLNHVITWGSIAQDYGSIILPLSMAYQPWSHNTWSRDLTYLTNDWSDISQSSALLAACLDTMTLPSRQLERSYSLTDMTSLLVQLNRKFISTSCALPIPIQQEGDLFSLLDSQLPFHHNLTPMLSSSTEYFNTTDDITTQLISVQGLTRAHLPAPMEMQKRLGSTNGTIKSILQLYLGEIRPNTISHVHNVTGQVKMKKTLPLTFSNDKSSTSIVNPQMFHTPPVSTLLQSSPSIKRGLQSLITALEASDVKRLFAKLASSIPTDDLQAGIETFREVISYYGD